MDAQTISPLPVGETDPVTHSPDGESRGLMVRVGDLFPLNPLGNVLARTDAPATAARPWGLRHLSVPQPRAGKHEGGTNETTGDPDGNSPGEEKGGD
ncbi:hypothetical protein [Actinomadura rubrisoli]|uniref:Uncharacterized protein n=1 Tax=Actinomadura rubrisoli TaxID=2530368 RepID=A0A4R5BCT5_9ACTN|nr:hypothetical protein [Actinomadura rubrisoli]TDD84318.1 hypothetical protein E1298_20175 [Actinomadura rubrisoli]